MSDTLSRILDTLLRVIPYEEKRLDNLSVIGGFHKFLLTWLDKLLLLNIPSFYSEELSRWREKIFLYPSWEKSERAKTLEEVSRLLLQLKEEIFVRIPLEKLKGIGKRREKEWRRMGITTVKELLYNFPRRYEDRRKIKKIKELEEGEQATIRGRIRVVGEEKTRKGRKIFKAIVDDGSGSITLTWFHQKWIRDIIKPGKEGIFTGRVSFFSGPQIVHPEFELLEEDKEIFIGGRIVPLYTAPSIYSQTRIRKLIWELIHQYGSFIWDALPEDIRKKYSLPSLQEALKEIHFPTSIDTLKRARLRFAWEELFLFQLALLSQREERRSQVGEVIQANVEEEMERVLPFSLTPSQRRVLEEIRKDLSSGTRMFRLLQGEVGSGKTVVALGAVLSVLKNGYQCAILAPTLILAEQHYLNFLRYLSPLGYEIAILTTRVRGRRRGEILERLKKGEIGLLIGTHAILQEEVEFKNLGLVVIDEQHRFGVIQRSALIHKGVSPHVLVMSATPIPRSLALALYGELDISTLDEVPGGRREVKTYWLREEEREKIFPFIREEVEKGRLVYYVVPRIKEKRKEMKSLEACEEMLRRKLPGISLGILHGRMKKEEQVKTMEHFRKGEIKILLCTPVVEVGVDVPQATVMVIENAERFGLSQLHQLRGRVGRGELPGYCFLIGEPESPEGERRMEEIMRESDGFRIAEADLRLRGPGELLGVLQHGFKGFRMVNILRAERFVEKARKEADRFLKIRGITPAYFKAIKEKFPEWERISLT